MLIALDYDGTYTADPVLWDEFVRHSIMRGHEVICVTMRYPTEAIRVPDCDVFYTSRAAKIPYLHALGIIPTVWIDDNPHYLFDAAV